MMIRSLPHVTLWFLLAPVLAILLLIGLADQSWSTFAHNHFHGIRLFVWLTWIAEPLPPLALIGLAGMGAAAALGYRPGPWARVLLAACLAVLIAAAAKEQLKFVFGRTWPETWVLNNPSWITDGVFTFKPFHGGWGFASFPSGHMAVITAPMAVLLMRAKRLRWLWAGLVLVVAVGLLGADYHWPSDVVAGVCVGWAAGAGSVALLRL